MKRVLISILVVVVVGVVLLGIRYKLNNQTQKRTEASYQSQLSSYSLVLNPGMKRKEVEDYLRAKNADFSRMCCVNTRSTARRHSEDDLVKIGEEGHPWFCSEHFVYVAFEFADHAQAENSVSFKDDDLDTLKSVSIYHQLGGCL
jgi:hypothetical protein